MTRRLHSRARLAALLILAAAPAACSDSGAAAEASPASGGAPKGPPGGGPGGPGGPGGNVVVLSQGDVATVATGPIEAGTAVTGDLRPIETVNVRARLEGDLDAVLVRDGDQVREGQLLARFDASEEESNRQSALADQAAAESEVATAQWNAEQSAELFRAGAIAEQADRAARQQLAAARARLAAAQARVRSASEVVRDARVLAPTSGVVSGRVVEAGERVSRGATLFTVVRNDRLELVASVPARSAADIRVGQPVRFVADGQQLEGRVARVSPTINPATRAIEVYVQVPNPNGRLKGNTFASGRIVGRVVEDAVIVPSSAVRQAGEAGNATSFAYRIADGAVERVPVQVGLVDDTKRIVQILDGLAVGDQVIVGQVGAVGAGARVQIVGEQESRGGQAGGAAPTAAPGGAPGAAPNAPPGGGGTPAAPAPLPRPRS